MLFLEAQNPLFKNSADSSPWKVTEITNSLNHKEKLSFVSSNASADRTIDFLFERIKYCITF